MFKFKKCILAAIGGCLLLGNTVFAMPVVVSGSGPSRETALHDAMRRAIEYEAGIAVSASSCTQNYQLVNDKIYTHTKGYIKSYEILEDMHNEHGFFVKIRAEISHDEIDPQTVERVTREAVIKSNLKDPRIGVAVVDRRGEHYQAAENQLVAELKNAGFSRIVDISQAEKRTGRRLTNAIFNDESELYAALKTQEEVDYLVTAGIEFSGRRNVAIPGFENFHTGYAEISVRLINVNSGEIVYADSFTATALHTDQKMSLGKAATKAAQGIAKAIAKAAYNKAGDPVQHIQLIVVSDSMGKTGSEVQSFLYALPGVADVFVRSVSYGNMIFDLNFNGNTEDLLTILDKNGVAVKEMNSEYLKI